MTAVLWLGVFPLAGDFSYAHITRAKWIAMGLGLIPTLACGAACLILSRRGGLRPRSSTAPSKTS